MFTVLLVRTYLDFGGRPRDLVAPLLTGGVAGGIALYVIMRVIDWLVH